MDAETKLIERIARAVPSEIGLRRRGSGGKGWVRRGIGNDGAVLVPGRRDWVLSCDAFLEGVHFLAEAHPPDSVGYKSLTRAVSDLAAMGATPRFFLLTLALPLSKTGSWLDGFLKGMARASRALGIRLIGGDTKKSSSVSISITVLGETAPGLAVARSGARPGDLICVTAGLGQAQLGLELVRKGLASKRGLRPLMEQHLYPTIRVKLGAWLARNGVASSMMDISDGLSTDLGRLCAASRVGARIYARDLPLAKAPAALLARLRLDPLEMALNGGDDYELLFTVPPEHVKRLQKAPGHRDIRAIGRIERGSRVFLVGTDGRAQPLESGGWDPFRKKYRLVGSDSGWC